MYERFGIEYEQSAASAAELEISFQISGEENRGGQKSTGVQVRSRLAG